MKIIVCVKRVVDYNVKVRARADGSGVDIGSAKMSMNPFDEIAVEAPIFQIADYGIVGDLFDILPQLSKALKQS